MPPASTADYAPPSLSEDIPAAPLAARFAAGGLRALINHCSWVGGSDSVEEVYDFFRKQPHEFLAVLDGGRLLGICARRQIGMLLGARYGFALFARKPVRAHLMPSVLSVRIDTPLTEVFSEAFSRAAEDYDDDAVLVDEGGAFLGLISMKTLVRLQHELLEENIAQLERSRQEIAEKNRQIEDDMRMARELQLALLPDRYPSFPPDSAPGESMLRFAHRFENSGIMGGDFFHVHPLGDKVASIFICDVMGHDVRAALVTAMLRALLEELQAHAADPAALLGQVNAELRQILRQAGGVMFATAAAVVLDAGVGEARYALAGHPSPMLLRPARGECVPMHPRERRMGPALGIFDQPAFSTHAVSMAAGDRLMLFTDGLFEAMNDDGEVFGHEALTAAIVGRAGLPLAELLDGVLGEVRRFCGGAELDDDVCLLGAEMQRVG